jgi:hypothetical protein
LSSGGRKLFCNVGDVVEFIVEVARTPPEVDAPVRIAIGSQYETVALIGWGWDLRRITGEGPDEIRILNSEMPTYVRVKQSKS